MILHEMGHVVSYIASRDQNVKTCNNLTYEKKLEETTAQWQARLIEKGSPVHGKLRGFLFFDLRESSLPNYSEISDELKAQALLQDDVDDTLKGKTISFLTKPKTHSGSCADGTKTVIS